MRTRFLSLSLGALVLGTAGQAMALDGWHDRRGLLFGLGLGGGIGQVHSDGLDSDQEFGINVRARVGGGVNERLTLDFDLGMHFQSSTVGPVDVDQRITTGMVGANFFLMDGLYLRGMAGMGHYSTEPQDSKLEGDSEVGLAVGVGAGYEFFANADLAIGVGADFRRVFFTIDAQPKDIDADFDLIGFGITATWY
ncbi:MAG: outer membrane beta-barrel protein [Myxococcales bacterium]|nr:outer membrane beta-barrel protein [Myxococcales bacterium]MCB9549416.1 outer membrane beta-barrel protein [Myxococcales bacterium]